MPLTLENKKDIAWQFAEGIAAKQGLPLPQEAKDFFVGNVISEWDNAFEKAFDAIGDKLKSKLLTESAAKLIPGLHELSNLEEQVRESLAKDDLAWLKQLAQENNIVVNLPTTQYEWEDQPALAEVKEEITDQQQPTKTPEINETLCDTKPLEEAKKHLGTKEWTGAADIFLTPFMGKWASAKKTPWCAGFVSYCLKNTWHEVSKNPVSAKSYANELGKWHIAFWDKEARKMIAGNYSDKVAYQPLPTSFERNTPERIDQGLFDGLPAQSPDELPDGAIIIMDRWSSQRNMA